MTITEFLDVLMKAIIAAAAGSIVTAVVIFIKNKCRRKREECEEAKREEKAEKDALKALSHDNYFRFCRYLIAQNGKTHIELENLEYLHSAYVGLGMNGAGEELYRICKELPLIEDKMTQ